MGIANAPTTENQLSFVNVSVALTAGGTPMDLTQMVVSYSDSNGGRNPNVVNMTGLTCANLGTTVTNVNNIQWCVSQKINDLNPSSPNNLLESNEIWVLTIQTPSTASINSKMTINLQPAVGAVLPLTRSVPGAINKIQAIY